MMQLTISEKQPSICLNMIVKNESHIIKNTLQMLCLKIKFTYWVICDTGSTDNTPEIIETFFKENNINGELLNHEWRDFAYNRTKALNAAYNKTDLLFIFDADDEICGNVTMPTIVSSSGYLLNFGSSSGISYQRPLLINNRIKWQYKSVIHEYIECLEPNPTFQTLNGDYYIISGRTGSRNKDPNKYLNDAQILEKAYYEAKQNQDSLYLRYAFYAGNSYADANLPNIAIKWYQITLENENWNQEKYMSCYKLFHQYTKIGEKEKGFFYLVESQKYDNERQECMYHLIQHYCANNMNHVAYQYYCLIKDYYETTYLANYLNNNKIINGKLFIEHDKGGFYIPYYMILVADKVKDKYPEACNTIYKMFQIAFTIKCKEVIHSEFYIGNLLFNLQFFFDLCIKNISNFVQLFQSYIDFLQVNNVSFNKWKHFLCKYEQYGITYSLTHLQIKQNFSLDICQQSNNILFYTGHSYISWNYSYSISNALGGSETAVAKLSKLFPTNYNIYVVGDFISEEVIDNIQYINFNSLKNIMTNTPFHTVIVSRYIDFYTIFNQLSYYQSFIWAHDTEILNCNNFLDTNTIIQQLDYKIKGCICQTEWHKQLFSSKYPLLTNKIYVINNGINIDYFNTQPIKFKNRFIYSSCAERGLERLLELWPQIINHFHDAELYISSYNTFPNNDFEKHLESIIVKYDSIKHVGCLNKKQLYELISSSEFWLYPTNWPETSCITSMEMLMGEVICIYYPIAGLVDTLGDYGIPVDYGNEIKALQELTTNKKNEIIKRGKEYALSCSWKNRVANWVDVLGLA